MAEINEYTCADPISICPHAKGERGCLGGKDTDDCSARMVKIHRGETMGKTSKSDRVIYMIGSLRNKEVPVIANQLRAANPNWEVFDSWFSPGPKADDYLRDYAKGKGLNYKETLQDYAAKHVFEFDKEHIDRATDVVLVMPAGKSGHLELGYSLGQGKRGYILFDKEPPRVDVMYQFATDIFFDFTELVEELKRYD